MGMGMGCEEGGKGWHVMKAVRGGDGMADDDE